MKPLTIAYGIIPFMSDPLGKAWEQPKLDEIFLNDEYAQMSRATCEKLKCYSNSRPSGVYPGKMWKAFDGEFWWLCWYGDHPDPIFVSINHRKISLTL